jgi:hypothetical protein
MGQERPVGSRRHKAQGIEIPKDEVMTDLMRIGPTIHIRA